MSINDKNSVDPLLIEFSKGMGFLRSVSNIKECFYHKRGECKGPIKQAHSIQKTGRLSIIEGLVDGENKLYTFTSTIPNARSLFGDLRPIGKKSASTFSGFCDYHDNILFAPIENNHYNDSDEHNFLHSYRSFAHTYHTKKEGTKGLKNKGQKYSMPDDETRISGYELGMADFEKSKILLDNLIENKLFDHLEYLIYHIPGRTHPIACASAITPRFYYNNEPFNNHLDEKVPYSDIMLTVLPDNNQTIIILACFPDDRRGIKFLDQLNELMNKSTLKYERAISSLIIANVENTFFAPALWEAWGPSGQRQLLLELDYILAERKSSYFSHHSFYHSKINFFDYRYSGERLGIVK